jgi:hypothetical protein
MALVIYACYQYGMQLSSLHQNFPSLYQKAAAECMTSFYNPETSKHWDGMVDRRLPASRYIENKQ